MYVQSFPQKFFAWCSDFAFARTFFCNSFTSLDFYMELKNLHVDRILIVIC